MPKVSVVIPTYNRIAILPNAVSSVLSQTYQDFEVIVVDDGSSDDIRKCLLPFHDGRIRYIRQKINCGAAAARNTGIREAKGEYIAFLDSDDEWLPDKLQTQMGILESAYAEWHGCCCSVYKDRNGTAEPLIIDDSDARLENILLGIRLSAGSTLLVRKSCFSVVGLLDERLRRYEEWDLLIRLSLRYKIRVLGQPLCIVHGNHFPSAIDCETAQKVFIPKLMEYAKDFGHRHRGRIKGNRYMEIAHLFLWQNRTKSVLYYLKSIYADYANFLKLINIVLRKVRSRLSRG